ncbi:hypothetical protein BJ878DRAFT_501234 [Calycina marina]|uniref:Uncharacterized protein n=1 Tax=Calycina marina TaxID=1763456 RepID=A0A9P7Z515_9HELO|nr:hypothetical protein BJ878DRAFT_501234 [Calycina marina]
MLHIIPILANALHNRTKLCRSNCSIKKHGVGGFRRRRTLLQLSQDIPTKSISFLHDLVHINVLHLVSGHSHVHVLSRLIFQLLIIVALGSTPKGCRHMLRTPIISILQSHISHDFVILEHHTRESLLLSGSGHRVGAAFGELVARKLSVLKGIVKCLSCSHVLFLAHGVAGHNIWAYRDGCCDGRSEGEMENVVKLHFEIEIKFSSVLWKGKELLMMPMWKDL